MKSAPLELVACKHVLGLIRSEQLPDIASQILAEGYDSPSLRVLAGLAASELDEARSLLDRSLAELNQPRPNRRNAVMQLAIATAKRILSRDTTPFQGAKEIWDTSLLLRDENLPELDSFVYAASEWQDRPADRPLFEQAIKEAARELVDRNQHSR